MGTTTLRLSPLGLRDFGPAKAVEGYPNWITSPHSSRALEPLER